MIETKSFSTRAASLLFAGTLLLTACGSSAEIAADTTAATPTTMSEVTVEEITDSLSTATVAETETSGETGNFQIEVWADNWSAVYVDGELVGEDSVSITTERSFNAETFTFEASYPFIVAIEAKDFKETDSGIEYIGEGNQQMGDGGIIAQITDVSTGDVVASTNSSWQTLVIHRAPLNTECVSDADPDATCQFEAIDTPDNWTATNFDDSGWSAATEWSAAAVSPKDGYNEVSWVADAQLIWGTDLEIDNTVLLRSTISN